jgi:ferredoxin
MSLLSGTQETEAQQQQHSVEVFADGKKATILVDHGESILSALERQNANLSLKGNVPFECRRGNCLTCAGRVLKDPQQSLVQDLDNDNGLSPAVAADLMAEENNFILTCSSIVVGEGVSVELGVNHLAWESIWSKRFQSDHTRQLGREASAKVIRLAAQQNVPRWTRKTEETLASQPYED